MGAHTHDFAVVLSPKQRCHRPDAVEGAGHVGLENLGPGLLRQAPEGAVARDPGAGDEEVDAPVAPPVTIATLPRQPLPIGCARGSYNAAPAPSVASYSHEGR